MRQRYLKTSPGDQYKHLACSYPFIFIIFSEHLARSRITQHWHAPFSAVLFALSSYFFRSHTDSGASDYGIEHASKKNADNLVPFAASTPLNKVLPILPTTTKEARGAPRQSFIDGASNSNRGSYTMGIGMARTRAACEARRRRLSQRGGAPGATATVREPFRGRGLILLPSQNCTRRAVTESYPFMCRTKNGNAWKRLLIIHGDEHADRDANSERAAVGSWERREVGRIRAGTRLYCWKCGFPPWG